MLRSRGRRRAAVLGGGAALCVAAFVVAFLIASGGQGAQTRAQTFDSRQPWPKRASQAAATTPPQPPTATSATAGVPLARLVGQMVMAGMDGTWPSGGLLEAIRAGRIGGVILFDQNVSSDLGGAIRAMQAAAKAGHNPPLLISTDQEGGSVKRLAAGPPNVPTREIQDPTTAESQGRLTGQFLQAQGVNVDLAPVSDVALSPSSFIATEGRGFSGDPGTVAELAGGFAQGLQSAGVAATGKHFPGVGALTIDTDNQLSTVSTSPNEAQAALEPFRRLVEGGVDLIMVASAVYPALDQSGLPADMSPTIIGGVLRDQLGFQGVAITDALDTPPQLGGSAGDRALRAARAGADIILFAPADAGPQAFETLLAGAREGQLSRSRIDESYARITALKQRLSSGQ